MKKTLACIAVALVTMLAVAAPGYARGGGHGGGGGHSGGGHFGSGHFSGGHAGHFAHPQHFDGRRHARVFVGAAPFVAFPFWWDYPAYAYAPPPVVVQEPPVYIEQAPAGPSDWYYCPSSKNYYPTVQTCPEPWVRVPAATQ